MLFHDNTQSVKVSTEVTRHAKEQESTAHTQRDKNQ